MPSLLLLAALMLAPGEPAASAPVTWETSAATALERARAEHRLVFVDYYAAWCEPCRKMESAVFPDPQVAGLLNRFVLLKVDFDRSSVGTMTLPTYKILDPWGVERLKFDGFQATESFARKLALTEAAAPAILQASQMLRAKDSVAARLRMAGAYMQALATGYARDEFEQARMLAKEAGNDQVAQSAEIAAGSTWVVDGEPERALTQLEKIALAPAGPESAAHAWLAIGDAKRQMQDAPGAADAYRRALEVCPATSPLRRSVETALASVQAPR